MLNEGTLEENIIEQSDATAYNEFIAEKSPRQVAGDFLRTYRAHAAKYLNEGESAYIQIHASSLPGERSWPRTAIPVRGTLEDINTALDWADQKSPEGRSIYFTLNPMSNPERRGKDAVAFHCAVGSDGDVYKVEGMTQAEGVQHVVNLGIHPNYIINTGRGIQPVYFIERSDYETWHTVNAGLYHATKVIGADKLDTDSSRVCPFGWSA